MACFHHVAAVANSSAARLDPHQTVDIIIYCSSVIKSLYVNYANEVSNSLTYIFNIPFRREVFPDDLKNSHVVIPVYKKGAKNHLLIIDPIYFLPSFSKVLKMLMFSRVRAFVFISVFFIKTLYYINLNHEVWKTSKCKIIVQWPA